MDKVITLLALILVGCGLFLCKVWYDALKVHGTRTFTLHLTNKRMFIQKNCLFAGGLLLFLSYAITVSGAVSVGNAVSIIGLLTVAIGSVVAELF